jgi:hypothetical protein
LFGGARAAAGQHQAENRSVVGQLGSHRHANATRKSMPSGDGAVLLKGQL